jgi:hypothetical protein
MESIFTDTVGNSYTIDIIGNLGPLSYMHNGLNTGNVKTAILGTNVTEIGYNAFAHATNLISIVISENVTIIENNAFANAGILTSVIIPDSVTSIEENAFYSSGLTSVTFGENSQLTNIGISSFNQSDLTSIIIPDGVTSIGNNAFYKLSNLASVTFGENSQLTNIGYSAFYEATDLTDIVIPNSVTTIGLNAFIRTTSLTSFIVGETSIGNNAFQGASNLTSITIYGRVTSIGTDAFRDTGLTTVYLTEDLTIYGTEYKVETSGSFFGVNDVDFKEAPPTAPICFPAGTPVTTDQGNVAIEKLNSHIHTIRGKSIVAITQTRPLQKHIVSIEKDALANNVPSQTTEISLNHKVFYKGQMVKAQYLVDVCERVHFISYNGETLYNVLLEEHDKMMINNLICETLSPKNIMAMISKMNEGTEKNRILRELTCIIKKNDVSGYKKLYASLK